MHVSRPHRALTIATGLAAMMRGPVRVGAVHSVFRHAANVWLPPSTLLAIASPTAVRAPNGVVVASSPLAEDAALLGLGAAMTAWVGGGAIRVPAAGLWIDATDVPEWDPRPHFPDRPIDPAILGRHLARLAWLIRVSARAMPWGFATLLEPAVHEAPQRKGVSRHARAMAWGSRGAACCARRPRADNTRLATPLWSGGPRAVQAVPLREAQDSAACQEPLTAHTRADARHALQGQRARAAASRLLAGIECGDTAAIASGARGLAGLGHGLTPSGDDFLIGVCGALTVAEAVAPEGQTNRRREQVAVIAAAAEGRTTLMSEIWLDHAARGEFSAEVGAVLEALAEPGAAGLDSVANRLLGIGGSSGVDTAVGVLLGSRAARSWRRGVA